MAYLPDSDHSVRLWDLATSTEQFRLVGHTGSVATLAWNPGADVLVSGSFDTTVRFWPLRDTAMDTASRSR